jgi:hypothetical protein
MKLSVAAHFHKEKILTAPGAHVIEMPEIDAGCCY